LEKVPFGVLKKNKYIGQIYMEENYSDLIPYIKLMKSYMMVSKLEALDLMNQED
jgi:hypothetical protein